jgi:hypothetical protein
MKKIILIAGKKQSGKNTLANQIAAAVINDAGCEGHYHVDAKGRLVWTNHNSEDILDITPRGADEGTWDGRDKVKIMSFADPIKEFCIDVLGLSVAQCYGTDADKNTLTNMRWDGLPLSVRIKYTKGWSWWKPWTWSPRCEQMTAREVMQVFGTDIMRAWWSDMWASAAIKKAIRSPQPIVIMPDTRFPNELEVGFEAEDSLLGIDSMFVRMKRCIAGEDCHPSEIALDSTPDDCFDVVVPKDLSVVEQEQFAVPTVMNWIKDANLQPPHLISVLS